MIRANGLGKGLDETSAFLIGENGYEQETRFEDEPARHKLLDLVGVTHALDTRWDPKNIRPPAER